VSARQVMPEKKTPQRLGIEQLKRDWT